MPTSKPLQPVHTPRLPPFAVVKMFLLASVSVIAAVWALVRFYSHPHVPMVVPASPAVAADAGASPGEIPAPEVEIVH
jgi:hypothetical protein